MSQRLGPAANPAVQGGLRVMTRQQQRQVEADLRAVLSTPTGRRFVWRLIDETAAVSAKSFTGDALQTVFREGQRHVGIAVMQEARRLAPDSYVLMQHEALASQAEEGVHRAAALTAPNPEEEDVS